MHEVVRRKQQEVAALCGRLGVRRLDVFGSATGDRFDERSSDVDVLVQFDSEKVPDYFTTYFELKEGLEEILGRPVDVVFGNSLENPYFREQVMNTRELMYAA